MLGGCRTIGQLTVLGMVAGAIFGVLVGALTGDYLIWVGAMAVVGAGFGVSLAYFFLPDTGTEGE